MVKEGRRCLANRSVVASFVYIFDFFIIRREKEKILYKKIEFELHNCL
jgi:hypothetical protein